jgi:hypothetical protein
MESAISHSYRVASEYSAATELTYNKPFPGQSGKLWIPHSWSEWLLRSWLRICERLERPHHIAHLGDEGSGTENERGRERWRRRVVNASGESESLRDADADLRLEEYHAAGCCLLSKGIHPALTRSVQCGN